MQKVKGWEGFVRSLVDRKEANVVISGSTASVNNKNVREVLAGRHLVLEVFPFLLQGIPEVQKHQVFNGTGYNSQRK
ncbi:AAA family ATPase [Saccharolobus islandicus]|uniref:AAA family ATPase n=1 Tax=Saccharolobus islandicus TaxID=43080 RepID=UPI002156FC1D|nr:AAA family ATPase [Sulfolobus islandicus]